MVSMCTTEVFSTSDDTGQLFITDGVVTKLIGKLSIYKH